MEKGLNSYYSLAADDLLYAKTLLTAMESSNKFNGVASLCSQSAEKFMKAFLEGTCKDINISLLKSHNIKTIAPACNLSEKEYKWLGDFYFEARYPGDDFTVVTLEEARDCIRLVKELKNWVDVNAPGERIPPTSGLKKLSELKETSYLDKRKDTR